MIDTWFQRELPVLEAAARLYEELFPDRTPDGEDIRQETDLPERDVQIALFTLAPTYLSLRTSITGELASIHVTDVTDAGRRAVGQWPSAESFVAALAAGIAEAAELEPDPDQRSKLKKTSKWLGGSVKEIAIQVAATILAKQSGAG